MKKALFIIVLTILIIGIVPASAEMTFLFEMGDSTLWYPVEESYIEGQQQQEGGPIRVSRGIGIGWFKPGNAVELLEKVDFGEGIISMSAKVAAQFPENHFEEKMPDAVFEIRIDSYDTGTVIATVKPIGTTSWEIMEEAEVTITEEGKKVTGEHTIYIVNKIGTPEEYLEKKLAGTSNFNELTIVTKAIEPTPTPTPEPTEKPTPSPTPTATIKTTPVVNTDNNSSPILYIVIGAVALVAIAVIVLIIIKKKKGKK